TTLTATALSSLCAGLCCRSTLSACCGSVTLLLLLLVLLILLVTVETTKTISTGAADSRDATVGDVNLQLFFVRFAGLCCFLANLHRSLDARGIHAIGHVISRQTSTAGFRGEIGFTVEQCGNRFGVPLFDSPHQ